MSKLLFEGRQWTFDTIVRIRDACAEIALEDLGLNVYPNDIRIVSSEQMLDAYASVGMPTMYSHWSFGKSHIQQSNAYAKGRMGLAYEMVINSNPCVNYCMEENSSAMQLLVNAHAAFGHNHFFKNNYLFKEWTNADLTLDYLRFAKDYIAKCEERYGYAAVEEVLDAAHALQNHGIFHSKPQQKVSAEELRKKVMNRRKELQSQEHYLWSNLEEKKKKLSLPAESVPYRLPEENILYFIEKNAPGIPEWKVEIIRIVRKMSEYFRPQMRTKVMNEGCATFVHYYITHKLWLDGRIDDSTWMEILRSHSNIISQPKNNNLNPYAIGFKMMTDIRRMAENPTDEDREYVPLVASDGDDWRNTLRYIWSAYNDSSFIENFLSPKVIRDMHLFTISTSEDDEYYHVTDIHDGLGYENIRETLARSYETALQIPDIKVVGVDTRSDRTLRLKYTPIDGRHLLIKDAKRVMTYVEQLWGYPVTMENLE